MSYKIAVASSDGLRIDNSFGSARFFTVYEVSDNEYHELEKRYVTSDTDEVSEADVSGTGCGSGNGCGGGSGCGSGSGCGGGADRKVGLISDCRCVVCTKIGFNVQKQLERKAISSFDVDCTIDEALGKITSYYSKIDSHTSLRR